MAGLTTFGLPPALEAAVRERLAAGELDVVVVGAGRQAVGNFLEVEQAAWDSTVDAVTEAFFRAQAAVREMLDAGRPGRVVFVASTTSLRPVQGASLDATAGGFLSTIAQVGAVELAAAGITVNTVVAGWLDGDDTAALVGGIPAGRLGTAAEIADAIAYLASPGASYVNGATLAVDGGFWITKSGGGSPLRAGS